MPWFKVDDHFHSHPKVQKCGLEVIGLWTVSGSYSMAHLTDGFVAEAFVKGWRGGFRLAAKLVAAGLWFESVKDGESGWQFHDWDKYQPTKAQVEAERKKSRDRKSKQRLSQGESRRDVDPKPFADNGMSRGESRGESRRTPGTVPARPPDPPSLYLVDSSGELTQVGEPEPPRFCDDHPAGTPNSCGPCKTARLTRESWEANEKRRRAAVAESERWRRENCPTCRGTGQIDLGPNMVAKCLHPEVPEVSEIRHA